MPYVNCWNSPENRLPPFKENDFSVNGDPLPFGLYLLDSFDPVPYLFQFFLFEHLSLQEAEANNGGFAGRVQLPCGLLLSIYVCCYFRACVETSIEPWKDRIVFFSEVCRKHKSRKSCLPRAQSGQAHLLVQLITDWI